MCGIIGVIGKTSESELTKFLEPVKHRGHYHFEIQAFASGGIGANRLAIVDPDHGKQPFFNEDKTVAVVFNGEIFNSNELREELKKKGHSFKTRCDTEIIPHLYEAYGKDFVKKIDSEMFAIILYDQNLKQWIIARDPLGVKPLYYATKGDRTFYASEAKQLVHLQTKIKIFPPGYLRINEEFVPYFTLQSNPEKDVDQENINTLRTLFEEAVKKRIPPDLPIGILFSGGIDSSAILVTAMKYTKDLRVFIVGNKSSEDRNYAEKLCKQLKVNYDVIEPQIPTEENLIETIRISESDEPNTLDASWPAYLACQQAAKHKLKVLLCGEGADELFGGYNEIKALSNEEHHKACYLLTKNLHLTQLPRVDRTGMAATIEIRCPFLDKKIVDLAMKLKTTRFKGRETKQIFREAMKDILPDWIVTREKVPFNLGIGLMFDGKGSVEGDLYKDTSVNINKFDLIKEHFSKFGYSQIEKPKAINRQNIVETVRQSTHSKNKI